MKLKFQMAGFLATVALLTFMTTMIWADDIKSRMLARLPEIEALKADGVIGEDKNGFLQFLKPAAEKQALVNSENADRAQVYKAIAAQQGATPEFVGKKRAQQIAEQAEPGEWLQNADGQWYQK